MPPRREIEVALQDSISVALRNIGSRLDELNVKAAEAGKAGGADGLGGAATETGGLARKSERANRALGGSSGSLAGVLAVFSRTLGPPAVLIGAFFAAAKALENFAASRTQLRSFAIDTNLTEVNVQELRQALAMMGRDTGEQNSIIAKLSGKLDRLAVSGAGSEVWQVLERAEGGSGMPLLRRWREMLKESGGKMATIRDIAQQFGQLSPAAQDMFALAFDMDKSVLGGLLAALDDVVPEARADAEKMRAHLLRMLKLREEWDAQWLKVKMFAVDVGVQVGAALEQEGVSIEGIKAKIQQGFDSINYEEVATALIEVGKNLETSARETAYVLETMGTVIEWIKKYSPIQIQYLTPEEQQRLEEQYAINEKLRIDKNSAQELAEIGIKLTQVLLGGEAGGGAGERRRGLTFRPGIGQGARGLSKPISIEGATEEEKNTLAIIEKYESGGQNIMNYVGRAQGLDPQTPKGYTAQGYFQILNTNWRYYAPRLGIKAPNAMAASREDQARVALALLRDTGIGNWSHSVRAAIARRERAVFETAGGLGGTIPGIDTSQRVTEAQQKLAGTRRGALDSRLRAVLDYASEKTGLTAEVFSGGQRMPGAPGATGSYRHDRGMAADFKLYDKEGRLVPHTDPRAVAFIEHAFSAGALSGGAAQGYMGAYSIDLGIVPGPSGTAGLYYGSQEQREAARRGLEARGSVIEQRLQEEARTKIAPVVKAQVNFRNVPSGVRTSVKIPEGKGELIKELTQSRSRQFSDYMPADL